MRRLLLIAFMLALPVAATAVLFVMTQYVLQASGRIIEPQVLRYSAAVEFAAFLLLAVLEVKNRW